VTITTLNSYAPEPGREFTMWTTAALVVCALHVGVAATYLLLKPAPEAAAEAPAFEVAFVPAATATAPAVPETQQTIDPAPPPDPSRFDPPVETPPPQAVIPEPEPPPPETQALVQPEPVPPPQALSIPEPTVETKLPDQVAVLPPEDVPVEIPQPPKETVITPPPQEKPITPPPEPAGRKPAPEPKVQKEVRKPPPKAVVAPETRPARVASAPNPGQESQGASEGRASWNSQLVAQIRRFATYSGTETGSVSVSVTIDRNGRLKSRRLVGSSGSTTLDRVAMDVLERAQPFPPFPPGMTEAQVVRVVPMHLRPR